MMTKLLVATTLASLSLATAAFAQSAGQLPPQTVSVGGEGYPAPLQVLSSKTLSQSFLPSTGGESGVQSPNAMPVNAEVGTVPYMQAQSVNRWVAGQAEDSYAVARGRSRAQPNG